MKIRCSVLLALCLATVGFAQEEITAHPLQFAVSKEGEGTAKNQLGYMRVTFKNVSGEDVRLLRIFDDESTLRFWFNVVVVATNGTPVLDTPAGGKISVRSAREYLVLKPQEAFSFRLDPSKLVPTLSPGSYCIKVIYSNQYGENCFQGRLESNFFVVKVP